MLLIDNMLRNDRLLMRSTLYHVDRVWYWLTETERQVQGLPLLDKVYMFPATCQTKQNETKQIETKRVKTKWNKRKRNKIKIERNKLHVNMTVGLINLSSVSHDFVQFRSPTFFYQAVGKKKKNEWWTYKKTIGRRVCIDEIGWQQERKKLYPNFGDEQIRYLDWK